MIDVIESSQDRVRLGSFLAQIGREVGGVDLAAERDPTPAKPVELECSVNPNKRR